MIKMFIFLANWVWNNSKQFYFSIHLLFKTLKKPNSQNALKKISKSSNKSLSYFIKSEIEFRVKFIISACWFVTPIVPTKVWIKRISIFLAPSYLKNRGGAQNHIKSGMCWAPGKLNYMPISTSRRYHHCSHW